MKRVLITGGCGFIGSAFIRHLLSHHPDYEVVNFDKLTYAGNPDNVAECETEPRYSFVNGDICDAAAVETALAGCDAVVNFAAESHVDRALIDPGAFIQTDVYGVYVLLEAARKAGVERFVQISTDEVYGPRFANDPAKEDDAFAPHNPYAASKAGAEMQCQAFYHTYRLPVMVTRSANNVGPRQHPEKQLPLFITNALEDKPLPVYGEGKQIRDRLYVDDNCEAIDLVLHKGHVGEAYNIGAKNERTNLDVAETILRLLGKPRDLIRFVEDRAGHDPRYSLDTSKIRGLGWAPKHDYGEAMARTVNWYQQNRIWWTRAKSGEYEAYYEQQYGERLANAKPI